MHVSGLDPGQEKNTAILDICETIGEIGIQTVGYSVNVKFPDFKNHTVMLKKGFGPGAAAHVYNPALWEAKAGGSLEVRSLRPAWPTW